jgi:predicted acylesterase/phospholipase RssA
MLRLSSGGAHGAFTWGVLDRLLEEKSLFFEGISATSAGAMNGTVLAYGLAVGGREGARDALAAYWKRISDIRSNSCRKAALAAMRSTVSVSELSTTEDARVSLPPTRYAEASV